MLEILLLYLLTSVDYRIVMWLKISYLSVLSVVCLADMAMEVKISLAVILILQYWVQLEYAENYWRPDRTNTQYPRPGGGSFGETEFNTFLLEDGTFVRLQTVALYYNIPVNRIGWNWVRNASVYLRGTNLYVWTNYTGFDPEGSWNGQSDVNPNIDLGNYPRPRSVELGVRLGF